MAQLLTIVVAIVILGWLWFFVVRPILEGFGVISVKDNGDVVMSDEEEPAPQIPASSLQTDGAQTPDRPMIAKPTPQQILDIFKAMRAAGIRREAIAPAWRAAGLPFDNNLWTAAAPPPPEEPTERGPISGRSIPSGVKFHQDDPELEYKPLRA